MAPAPSATKIRTRGGSTEAAEQGIGVGVCRFGPGLWQDVEVTDQSGYPGAPPGWYPDPAGGPGQRWWDGYAWTESTVLPQQPPPPPWASASPPQGPPTTIAPWAEASQRLSTFTTSGLVDNEMRLAPLSRFAIAIPPVYCLVYLIENRINAQALLNVGHQFRIDFHDAEVGKTAPAYHGPTPGFGALFFLLFVVTCGAVILTLVWQHRAASAGRALGIPSRHSPAWGVGAWFVPVVNLWIPYFALRDCLPPGDPRRAHVLQWWTAGLIAGTFGIAAGITAFFSSGAALVLSIPAGLACIAVLAWAPGVVTAIATAHRDAMSAAQKSGALTG
jgi:Domain of unknown function (DUF4328)/Protein of unknown function (DUF2510)